MIYKVAELPRGLHTGHRLLSLFCCVRSELDLDLNTSGELDVHQSVHSLLRGLDDVNETLVRSHLELLAAILVLVHRTKDRDDLTLRGERYGTGNSCAVSLSNFHDLLGCGVDQGVVVAGKADANFLLNCHLFCLLFDFRVSHVRLYIK